MTSVAPRADDALASLLVGKTPVMQRLRTLIHRVAPARLPVLIVGPTGSGKELVANALHLASGRKGAFVALNVCAVTDTMFEDALFGHLRGAFTGAANDAAGYLTEADKGTVFLDEISGLPISSQSKLLRAIETQTFRPLGAGRDRRSDFRVLAASNEDLHALSAGGRFRLDLLHRLAGITLRVPPLSERRNDIPLLASAFLRATSSTRAVQIEPRAEQLLSAAEWPGNVRQLKHVVELSFTLNGNGVITEDAVRSALAMDGSQTIRALRLDDRDQELLRVLREVHWDVLAAANVLGLHRATVYRRLVRLNGRKLPHLID